MKLPDALRVELQAQGNDSKDNIEAMNCTDHSVGHLGENRFESEKRQRLQAKYDERQRKRRHIGAGVWLLLM